MNDADLNTRRARRLLRAITDLARDASLTGSLERGARTAIRQYNGLLEYLSKTGVVPRDLFSLLDEDEATFDELGVACALLSAFIEDEETENQPATTETIVVTTETQELSELRELGQLIREHMPEVLRIQEARRRQAS